MGGFHCEDTTWWLLTFPAIFNGHLNYLDSFLLSLALLLAFLLPSLVSWALTPGGPAWRNGRGRLGRVPIPGHRGLPVLGSLLCLSGSVPHRVLDSAARGAGARGLMAFSIGETPAVVTSDPAVAEEILGHPSFADRPTKQSARELMFGRAMGFAPAGPYWKLLRSIAAVHMFAPRRIAAHEANRRADCGALLRGVGDEQERSGRVVLRRHLQQAALNNIMGTIFGKRYDVSGGGGKELQELREMAREGFELLGAFNWCDHLPWLSSFYDPGNVARRCAALVPRVRKFVKEIIDDHRARPATGARLVEGDFVDVLLSLEGESKLDEDDMIAVLWEMIFRSTDNTALLTEWILAELVLNPQVQAKLRAELGNIDGPIADAAVARLPYLQAIVKETLRLHPPGPLLSWARLSTSDVQLSNGMVVPANTTAMVNMWAITHDPAIWPSPLSFKPERFVGADNNVDVRGGNLRLAPFGAGRRVCPGKNLGLTTIAMWVARLVAKFDFVQTKDSPVDLEEVLKLSCEMKNPLVVVAMSTGNDATL